MSLPVDTTRPQGKPLLLVTVGSDHHPFDRVIDWVDDYLFNPHQDLVYVCQYGAAHPPRFGDQHQSFVEHDRLLELFGQASAVVSHGGPGSLLETLRRGRLPIAVPREQRYGEVVDDHQHAFCEFLAERREVVLADTEARLHQALDRMLTDPAASVAPRLHYDADCAEAVQRFALMVGQCRPARRGRLLTQRRLRKE